MKKNKKGFTLVELLAVIVVLAILILLALPKVTSMMEKARRKSFTVEANTIVKVAQTAYADKLESDGNGKSIWTITDLISENYLEKDKSEISGCVVIKVDNSTGNVNYMVYLQSEKGYYVIRDGENSDKSSFTDKEVQNGHYTHAALSDQQIDDSICDKIIKSRNN